MKNDLVCNLCMYKHVPAAFSPCLGCREGNIEYQMKEKNQREKGGSDHETDRC